MVAEVSQDIISMSGIQLSEYLSIYVQYGQEWTLFEFTYPLGTYKNMFLPVQLLCFS